MEATRSRHLGTLFTLVLGLLLFSLVSAPAAHACSCTALTFEQAADAADLIADVSVGSALGQDGSDVTYSAVVDTVWKGEESRTITLRTAEETTACGLGRIAAGTRLLVWATGADGAYSSTWCALPADGGPDDRERLTELLGEPADLTDQPVPAAAGGVELPPTWVLVGGAAVAGTILLNTTALVVAAVLVLRRRRR
jgi:hypothetical protein